jgi:hypothetical protein
VGNFDNIRNILVMVILYLFTFDNSIVFILNYQINVSKLFATVENIKSTQVAKKPLVICNSIFSIFLNQIKAQRDLKIIVWIEYFPYKYSFKVISND